MKFLFDLFPVILFYSTFMFSGRSPQAAADFISPILGALGLNASITPSHAPILVATLVVIIATTLQVAWVWLRHGKVDKILWVSLVLVLIFGSLTLIFQDEAFIKVKLTIIYWIFATTLLFSATVLKKNLIRNMLETEVKLPEPVWHKLNLAWVGFFALIGALNLLIAFVFNLSTTVWVNFKMFGTIGLTIAFIVVQGMFLARYIEDK
jgi:intracellular septation protein